jgi:hypothetical protein
MESREHRVGKIIPEAVKLHYDDKDGERITEAAQELTQAAMNLLEKMGLFHQQTEAEVTEDSKEDMRYARQELVEAWGRAQLTLSGVASVFHVDGDEAFKRYADFAEGPEDAVLDLSGL